jgi:murein L,D-transpeptidase YcbB/YkuD
MKKKRGLLVVTALLLCSTAPASAASWTPPQLASLKHWAKAAPEDALPRLDTAQLDRAMAGTDAVDQAATEIALRLARLHVMGSATSAERAGWRIADSDGARDVPAMLEQALSANGLDAFFADLRPHHPVYGALRAAYAAEKTPARRTVLARNMERWRWMPLSLGQDYVLVYAASFEASLWRRGAKAGTWPVIVGKPSTPTPVFAATITGVTLNPWWDVPASIVRESVGSLTRRSPALARQRGFVWGGGSYRQRPGPGNALGLMKLAMANPFNVYMHDTPTKNLFARDFRAFSHGCIRIGDALGFAATLLEGVKTRAEMDRMLATSATTTVDLAAHLPVYVTYFTASVRPDGSMAIHPDIYGQDGHLAVPKLLQ